MFAPGGVEEENLCRHRVRACVEATRKNNEKCKQEDGGELSSSGRDDERS